MNSRIYGEKYEGTKDEIKYLPEFLDFLRVFTGDERFTEISKELVFRQKKGGAVSMCNILDYRWNKGHDEGLAEGLDKGLTRGRAEGEAKIITTLYRNVGSIARTAELSGKTEQQVREILGILGGTK